LDSAGALGAALTRRPARIIRKKREALIGSNCLYVRSISMPRVSLNQNAPDFSLADYRGNAFRLSHLCGKKNVLLVFNRTFT
jgi:hypothetical protein